ncbi:MAG: hypothetical protein IJA11_06600 [Oscillospiraceae bacterium]|nr:hypothetical protein [Oscillospiraceae bacterium]
MQWGLLNGPERLELEDGRQLRLLSAFEVLQARAEARQLAGDGREMALCANACLLARAVLCGEAPQFRDGTQVLAELTVEEIERLAGRWARFNRTVNPGPKVDDEEADRLKKAWSTPGRSGCTGACCELFQPCPRRNGSEP